MAGCWSRIGRTFGARARLTAIAAALLAALLPVLPAAAAEGDAAQVVETMAAQAQKALNDPKLGPAERRREFREILTRNFDLPVIGRVVVGRHWRDMNEAQRAEFQKLLSDYIVALYAGRLEEHAKGRLVVESADPVGDGDRLVRSRYEPASGPPAAVDWRLRQASGGWRVIDVVVEGVSLAVTKRSEIDSLIDRQGGVEALLAEMRQQAPGATATR